MKRNTVLTLGLLSLASLGLVTAEAGVKLILNESTPLGMVGNTEYDLDNNLIEITLDRPVLCNQAPGYNASGLTKLRIYDPNLEMKGFNTNDGLYFADDADYLVNDGQLVLVTYNPVKALCVSALTGNDLIYRDHFEVMPQTTAEVRYVNLPSIVSPGQEINYQIEFTNPSAQLIYFDLLEYWDHNSSKHNAYLTADNERTCNNNDPKVSCSVALYDNSGIIKGIQLDSGGTFVLDVTQTVHQNSAIGGELDFMAGVFLTDSQSGDFLPRTLTGPHFMNNPITVTKTVSVQTNNPPVLNWDVPPASSTVSFYEDLGSEQFKIRYNDAETSSQNLTVTVSDQQGNIVHVTKGPYVADSLDGTMTLDVSPVANAFTKTGAPEQITVTVTDAGGLSATLDFDVEVIPVNDAPTFAMNCSELTINEQVLNLSCTSPIVNGGDGQTQGTWGDEYIIADFNAGPNESDQYALEYEVEIVHNDDNVLDNFGNSATPVTISATTGEVTIHTNNEAYGSAEVRVRVKDNGGTTGPDGCGVLPNNPENGCDVSGWETLTIVSEAPVYTLSGIINGLPQGSFVNMNLQDAGNGNAFVENENKTNSTGDDPLAFSFDYEAEDQFNYKVVVDGQSNGLNCDIESASGTEPNADATVGTVNGANVTDLVVSCVAD